MSARETLNRWIEAMQILCGDDDSPTEERRADFDECRRRMLDAHRSEVLYEVTQWLVKKAREYRAVGTRVAVAQANAVDAMASKISRGAVRADNLRMLPPDFFQPGHTYTEPDGSTDWQFRCDIVTTHPEDGERTALGWRHFRGEWTEYAYGEDDWEIHRIADSFGGES